MHQVLNKLLNWILYTSIFAASCAVGMCMATEKLLLGKPYPVYSPLHVLIFGGVLLVYNVHFVIKKSTPALSDRFGWSQHYKLWHYLFILVGLIAIILCLFSLPEQVLIACIVLAVLSFGYSIPFLPFINKKRLRDYGWIKILLLASVWTIVTAVFPIIAYRKQILDYPFEILIRFVLMFSLCLVFDIRDMQTDTESGIATVPNRIGIRNSYMLIDASIFMFVAFSIVQYFRYPSVHRIMAEILTALIVKMVIAYTKHKSTDRIYLGLVDGIMLLYALLVLLS